jgi:predicted RNase H-like nuclease
MTTIVGADGCRSGWLCIFEELPTRRIGSKVFATIADLFAAAPTLDVLAIDIPIGLTDAGPRECDAAARTLLGPIRGTSVFAAPIRPALHAASYTDACDISFKTQQKKLSKQSWAIYPKIRELDDLLRTHSDLRERVYEVHPEVTFATWNGAPIVEPKKKQSGFAARHDLVSRHFGTDVYKTVRARYRRDDVADDDILDAFAALWTAERILRGDAQSLPTNPALDSAGLPMRMMY